MDTGERWIFRVAEEPFRAATELHRGMLTARKTQIKGNAIDSDEYVVPASAAYVSALTPISFKV